jgi:heme/copper-type cytochrome/quinol oxidase subunit 4
MARSSAVPRRRRLSKQGHFAYQVCSFILSGILTFLCVILSSSRPLSALSKADGDGDGAEDKD